MDETKIESHNDEEQKHNAGEQNQPSSEAAKITPKNPEEIGPKVKVYGDSSTRQNAEKKSEEIDLKTYFSNGKFKGIFARKKKSHASEDSHHKKSDVSIGEFLKKYRIVLLILIPLILCFYLRVQPAYLPVADEWGQNNVNNFYRSQIETQINAQYPNLPGENKNLLIDEQLNKFIDENKDKVEGESKQSAEYLRSQFQDDTGQTYLLEIDPWSWYRDARNYMEKGYGADVYINGRYYDNHRLAPLLEEDIAVGGSTQKIQYLHPYFEVVSYKIWKIFDSDVSLMRVAFYGSLILSLFAIFPAFFLVRRFAGDIGGLVAATLLAINPFAITRTVAGFSDTDPYNLLLPLMIIWFLVLAIESNNLLKRTVYSALCGASMGLYSYAWGGWMFIVNICILTLVGMIAFKVVKMGLDRKFCLSAIKNLLMVLILLIIFGSIFTGMFGKFDDFYKAPGSMISFIELRDVATKDIWPNVFTTVAELNPGDINTIISTIGGKLFLLFALLGVMSAFYIKKKMDMYDIMLLSGAIAWFSIIIYKKEWFGSITTFVIALSIPIIVKFIFVLMQKTEDTGESRHYDHGAYNITYPLMLSMYLFATMFAVSRGVRFSLLLVPIFSICVGAFIGITISRLSEIFSDTLSIKKWITYTTLIVLVGLLFIQPFNEATLATKNEIPLINDQWYAALTKIRESSNETAIVNSWWDYGHWFKAIADRGVTLDGGGQDKPQAHWLGKLMLAKDENESVGVLRLLVCGKNFPYDRLASIMNDGVKAKNLVDKIILVDKSRAEEMLKENNIPQEDITYILSRTHCDPPEDYFITSEDMVSKSGVWGHFGSWDFNRASMYFNVHDKQKTEGLKILNEEFNLSDEDALKYYTEIQTQTADNWIATWPGYVTQRTQPCKKSAENPSMLICPVPMEGQTVGMTVDLEKRQAYVSSTNGDKYYPNEIYFPTKDGLFKVKGKEESVFGMSATLIPAKDGNYNIILSHPLHAGSTFTRLFYMEGHGLKHFKKFYDVTDVTGARIIVWKVDWEGKEADQPYKEFFEPKAETNAENAAGTEATPDAEAAETTA